MLFQFDLHIEFLQLRQMKPVVLQRLTHKSVILEFGGVTDSCCTKCHNIVIPLSSHLSCFNKNNDSTWHYIKGQFILAIDMMEVCNFLTELM